MIKQLIEDLTFDRITLSQALTRAKIISYKIRNPQFKEWIISELNGYKTPKNLPSYRVAPCDVFAEIANPFRGKQMVPFDVSPLEKEFEGKVSFYSINIIHGISLLENMVSKENIGYCYEELPQQMVNSLRELSSEGNMIISVRRRIQVSQMEYVINSTKQKLLDTLLELDDAFPNFENEYKNDSRSEKMAQTIINQNIYGDYASSNIGVGENITQTAETNVQLEQLIKDIKGLGVEENDANEIKEIILHEKKENRGNKLVAWLGKITTKAVEKGMDIQIPILFEKIRELL